MPDFEPHIQRRIDLTTAVRATDSIKKVKKAGTVTEHGGTPVQVMHNGVLVREGCYYGDWMTEVIRELRGHHEPQEELVFDQIVKRLVKDTPTPTMIELGSFWAYYSLWVKHVAADTRCVLVEPDAVNLQVGVDNFALNDMTPAAAVHAAVGSKHGSSIRMSHDSDGAVRKVPVVSIDGLIADQGLERVDLLLCDVQGAELAAIQGASKAIANGRLRFAVISTHHHLISGDPLTHQKCLAELERLGAQIIAEHTVLESCSGDGLIAVSFDERDRGFTVEVPHVRAKDTLFGDPEYELAEALRPTALPRRAKDRALASMSKVKRTVAARRRG